MIYTDRVPYHGLVNWTPQQIASYAAELAITHTASRFGWVREKRCTECGTTWPCYAGWWAQGELRETL